MFHAIAGCVQCDRVLSVKLAVSSASFQDNGSVYVIGPRAVAVAGLHMPQTCWAVVVMRDGVDRRAHASGGFAVFFAAECKSSDMKCVTLFSVT